MNLSKITFRKLIIYSFTGITCIGLGAFGEYNWLESNLTKNSNSLNNVIDTRNIQNKKNDILKLNDKVAQLGEILASEELSNYGLIAWLIRAPNGQKMTLYTTIDGKVIFNGALWDLDSKQNLNVNLVLNKISTQPRVQPIQPIVESVIDEHLLDPAYKGKIPEAIAAIDTLGGVKIGNSNPGGTLYIIIDPRCPYCHQAYNSLKPYMDRGVTIKWIPTVALGKSEDGLMMANAILHAKNRSELDEIMSNPKSHTRTLTDQDRETLQRNLLFMFQAFQESSSDNPGVPVAFFVDKNTNQARMMMGISEEAIIKTILGK